MEEVDRKMLVAIYDKTNTRDDIVPLYTNLIMRYFGDKRGTNVKAINDAIRERWSSYALKYIKEEAWKPIDDGTAT
jgi:hypothetical protein